MDDFWGSRTILVTGGTGFLGSYVVEKLRQRRSAFAIWSS